MGFRFVKFAALFAVTAIGVPAVAAPAPKPAMFAICSGCHKVGKDEKSFLAPNLFGVGGRQAGTFPGFAYSPAMKGAKIVWTRDKLIAFITDPRKTVPGTRMIYMGQKNPPPRSRIISSR